MLTLKIYTVHDAAVQAHGTPFFAGNDLAAIRMFTGLVNDPNSAMSIQPSDFTLYCIGAYDALTGHISADELRRVRNGLALVRQQELPLDSQEKVNLDNGFGMDETTGDITNG